MSTPTLPPLDARWIPVAAGLAGRIAFADPGLGVDGRPLLLISAVGTVGLRIGINATLTPNMRLRAACIVFAALATSTFALAGLFTLGFLPVPTAVP